jgi:hypothetical protein
VDNKKQTRTPKASMKPPSFDKMVWVTVGKTEHQAWLVEEVAGGQELVLIRWESTRGQERVPSLSIRHNMPSRRGRSTRTQISLKEPSLIPTSMSSAVALAARPSIGKPKKRKEKGKKKIPATAFQFDQTSESEFSLAGKDTDASEELNLKNDLDETDDSFRSGRAPRRERLSSQVEVPEVNNNHNHDDHSKLVKRVQLTLRGVLLDAEIIDSYSEPDAEFQKLAQRTPTAVQRTVPVPFVPAPATIQEMKKSKKRKRDKSSLQMQPNSVYNEAGARKSVPSLPDSLPRKNVPREESVASIPQTRAELGYTPRKSPSQKQPSSSMLDSVTRKKKARSGLESSTDISSIHPNNAIPRNKKKATKKNSRHSDKAATKRVELSTMPPRDEDHSSDDELAKIYQNQKEALPSQVSGGLTKNLEEKKNVRDSARSREDNDANLSSDDEAELERTRGRMGSLHNDTPSQTVSSAVSNLEVESSDDDVERERTQARITAKEVSTRITSTSLSVCGMMSPTWKPYSHMDAESSDDEVTREGGKVRMKFTDTRIQSPVENEETGEVSNQRMLSSSGRPSSVHPQVEDSEAEEEEKTHGDASGVICGQVEGAHGRIEVTNEKIPESSLPLKVVETTDRTRDASTVSLSTAVLSNGIPNVEKDKSTDEYAENQLGKDYDVVVAASSGLSKEGAITTAGEETGPFSVATRGLPDQKENACVNDAILAPSLQANGVTRMEDDDDAASPAQHLPKDPMEVNSSSPVPPSGGRDVTEYYPRDRVAAAVAKEGMVYIPTRVDEVGSVKGNDNGARESNWIDESQFHGDTGKCDGQKSWLSLLSEVVTNLEENRGEPISSVPSKEKANMGGGDSSDDEAILQSQNHMSLTRKGTQSPSVQPDGLSNMSRNAVAPTLSFSSKHEDSSSDDDEIRPRGRAPVRIKPIKFYRASQQENYNSSDDEAEVARTEAVLSGLSFRKRGLDGRHFAETRSSWLTKQIVIIRKRHRVRHGMQRQVEASKPRGKVLIGFTGSAIENLTRALKIDIARMVMCAGKKLAKNVGD